MGLHCHNTLYYNIVQLRTPVDSLYSGNPLIRSLTGWPDLTGWPYQPGGRINGLAVVTGCPYQRGSLNKKMTD